MVLRNNGSDLLFAVFVIIGFSTSVTMTDVGFQNDVAVKSEEAISTLSKLLLSRLSTNSSGASLTADRYIKSLKIEIDFAPGEEKSQSLKTIPWVQRIINNFPSVKKGRLKRDIEDRSQKSNGIDLSLMIPTEYIVVVKLGVPVNNLNQSSLYQLRAAFAYDLDLPLENVNIDKIRYHGNDIEMFFVRPDVDPLSFSFDDLIPSQEVVMPEIVESVKNQVPMLNITSIYMQLVNLLMVTCCFSYQYNHNVIQNMQIQLGCCAENNSYRKQYLSKYKGVADDMVQLDQFKLEPSYMIGNVVETEENHEVVFTSYPEPIWTQVSFRYVIGACGGVVFILTVSLIYCCCKKKEKTLKETDDEIRASQTIFYPSVKPDTKNPLMIQPENDPAFNPSGCVTPLPAQPVRAFKRKGLLERRGSSASLKIKLGPTTPDSPKWDGVTPPKECTGVEFLLTAGHRLSCQDLKKSIKNPRAIHQEFWEVPMNHPDKISVAGSGMKNRYRTIIPNEHTRVILPDSEWDPLSSYINANYIRGYEAEPKAYIATQGPIPASIVDFWHMVWHQKSPIIVMITKLKEKNKTKCENYLPDDFCTTTFGDIDVKVEKTICKNGYTVRNLVLKCNGECQYVLHFWYTAWPDHKPPESPTKILELVKEVEQKRYADNSLHVRGPVIVHCSAGIGRTGCFIGISIGMRQLFEEQSVDILGSLCSMRIDRGGMIQTHEQYEFVHHALCQYEKELETEQPGGLVPD